MCPAPDERMAVAFLDQLIGLLAIPRVHLLLVLRADAFPTLGHALCQRVKESDLCVHRLAPMTAAELREAIEGPAREMALFFDLLILDRHHHRRCHWLARGAGAPVLYAARDVSHLLRRADLAGPGQ